MEKKITESLEEILSKEAQKFIDDPIVKEYEKASKEFDALVDKGLAIKRGYNLLTIENTHLYRISFNSKS